MTAGVRRLPAIAPLVLALGACERTPPSTPILRTSLSGAVARVADVEIPPSLVESVARAKRVSVHEALDDLVGDALAAEAARAGGFDRNPAVAWQSMAAVARGVPSSLIAEAMALGPPSDDELALVSVVHAVVRRSPTLGEDEAIVIANAIREAVVSAKSPEDFEARAGAVAHPHAGVTVERIGPFAANAEGPDGSAFDADFVAASFALRTPHETTPIVVTPFGWHVIQLVERTRPEGALADRRRDLADAVAQMRARAHLAALLRARNSGSHVTVSVGADALMAAVTAPP